MFKSTSLSKAVLVAVLAFSACETTKVDNDDKSAKTTLMFLSSKIGGTDKAPGTRETYNSDGLSWEMVYVPAKNFLSGIDDNVAASVPGGYLCADTEVTYELWQRVYTWATTDAGGGLRIDGGALYYTQNAGFMGSNPPNTVLHPVTAINWRDAMVWTNAVTEWYNANNGTDLTCAYFSDPGYTTPIRDSRNGLYPDSTNPKDGGFDRPYIMASTPGNLDMDNCTATGFRIITSDEWELAARYIADANGDGDISDPGEYYPGTHASGDTTSYCWPEDTGTSTVFGVYSWNLYNSGGVTHEVAGRTPNALGIHDMGGNAEEWCFDWHPDHVGVYRIMHGGHINFPGFFLRVGYATYQSQYAISMTRGFRIVKNP